MSLVGMPARTRLVADRGAATSLSVALLTPVFVVLAFAAVQAALWTHARTEARVAARDAAALVARSGGSLADAASSTAAVLSVDTAMTDVDVTISESNGIVAVTVEAEAPGIIRGTSRRIDVTVALPLEEFDRP